MRLAILLALGLASCCPRPTARPDPGPVPPEPWAPLVQWYDQRSPDGTACPPESLVGELVAGAMDLDAGWAMCRVRLSEAQAIAGIDARVYAGQLNHEQDRAESYRSQRWTWGAVGVAVGAIVSGLLVGLAR